MMRRRIFILILLPGVLLAQADKKSAVWQPLKFFVGAWEGTGKGQSGISKIEREYQFVLNGRFLQTKNKSIYEPQEKNPKGEVHEDWGLISRDGMRKKFVLRQFHVEGFVNQYALDSLAVDGRTLVFVTESIENIPAGWRARETYKILNDVEFAETFELAEPGKGFEVYTENHLRRKK
jgi:hypothetical protein